MIINIREERKNEVISFKCRTLNNTLLRRAMTNIGITTVASAKTVMMEPSRIDMSHKLGTWMTALIVAIELSRLTTSCRHATQPHPLTAQGSTSGAQAAEALP